jgi:ubiquinone biosynthesis protein
MTNDVRSQLQAMADLGALPADTDFDVVIGELKLDQPTIDPTSLSSEELVAEVQRVVKALLGYGARLPKELMLYVKNLVFLDGAIAALAPDLDIIGEVTMISMRFAEKHGAELAGQLGMAPDAINVDMTGFKASLGLDSDVNRITYREPRTHQQTHARQVARRACWRGASAGAGVAALDQLESQLGGGFG